MRVSVPILGSVKVIDTQDARKGVSIQNVSAVDVYFSDDQRLLDSVDATNLPTVGHLLATATPVNPPVVYPWFIGRLFCRAQNNGAQVEVIVYEVDLPCRPLGG